MRLRKAREPLDLLVVQHLDRQQRDQAHQRPHALQARRAVAQGIWS